MMSSAATAELPASAAAKAPASAWFTLAVLVATLLFGFVDRQMLSLVAAPLVASLHLSDSQLGLVQGLAFSIFSAVCAYPIALLADRIDRRLVLALCIVIWACGTAACGLAQNFVQLFIAAVAIAAGEAGLPAIAFSVVPELFAGRQRVTANFVFYVASILGVSLGLVLGGTAVAALESVRTYLPAGLRDMEAWRLAFLLVAAPAPLFLLLVSQTTLRRAGQSSTALVKEAAGAKFVTHVRRHARAIVLVVLSANVLACAFGGLVVWTPVAMARLFGATPAQNGAGLGVAVGVGSLVGVAAGAVLLTRLAPRLGRIAPLRLCWLAMVVGGPPILLLPFVSAPWQAYVLVAEQMMLGVLIGSLVPGMLQDLAPAGLRARLIAMHTVIACLTSGLSVLATGALSDMLHMESRGLLVAVTATAIPAWLLAAGLMRAGERPFERFGRRNCRDTGIRK